MRGEESGKVDLPFSLWLTCLLTVWIITTYKVHLFCFFCSQLTQKKSFQSSSSYAPFCPDKSGAISLKDYQSLQSHEQYVQTLKECGFSEEEIQFKLEQEGYVSKVSLVCYVY